MHSTGWLLAQRAAAHRDVNAPHTVPLLEAAVKSSFLSVLSWLLRVLNGFKMLAFHSHFNFGVGARRNTVPDPVNKMDNVFT